MDSDRFDTFTRIFGARTRRGLASLLGGVALGGMLSPLLAPIAGDAKKKQQGKKGHGDGARGHNKKHHDKKEKSRKNDERAGAENCIQTGRRCPAGKRGGKGSHSRLSCERCCQGTFQIAADGKKRCACKPDGVSCDSAAQCCNASCQGGVCGPSTPASPPPPPSPACAASCPGCCDGETCRAGTSPDACGADGETCVACVDPTPLCVNRTCTASPPPPACAETCAGCCDGEECLAGNSPDACGDDGAACAVCANPAPLCLSRTCTACSSHAQCGSTSLCDEGSCLPCDVCPSGCLFTSVQDAINASNAGEVIRICPGLYPGNLEITHSLTVIGAGDGNGAGNTILQGTNADSGTTVTVTNGVVALAHLRITGGEGIVGGGGIANLSDGTLTLTSCTVNGNQAQPVGGGILNSGTLNLIDCTVSGNMVIGDGEGGGISNSFGGTLTLTNTTVSGNLAFNTGGGIHNSGTAMLDAASRVTGNEAFDNGGGIYNEGTVNLSSTENITDNEPNNCAGPNPVDMCVG